MNQDQVASAISAAHSAARAAGVGDDDTGEQYARVSYVFRLTGLSNPQQVSTIEATLERVPGVQASVVYPTETAWVTADETIGPELLIDALSTLGVGASLTPASALRHSAPSRIPPRMTRKRGKRRPSVARRERDIRRRLTGSESSGSSGDVLFTARALVAVRRLLVSLPLAVIVLGLSYVPAWQFPWWQWIVAGLSLPVVVWGGWPFHRAAAGGLRRGLSALDAASSVAIVAAWGWSLGLLLLTPAGDPGWTSNPQWFAVNHTQISDGTLFFDVACGITVLLLAGRLLTRRNSRDNLLTDLDQRRIEANHPVTVARKDRVTRTMKETSIPLSEVRVGDDILVEPGEVIPADGFVIGGASTVLPAIAAGDATREVKVNSPVYAGGINRDTRLKIRTTRTGHMTRMAAIYHWVQEAIARENRHARASIRSASVLVPAAFIIAVMNFGLWALISGSFNAAFSTSLAVLACVGPVALALSTALATRHSIETAARHGLLVRSGETLRHTARVDTAIFNRVGTLVAGEMTVDSVTAIPGTDPDLVLRVAGALAMESEHTAYQALVKAAREARDSDDTHHYIEVGHVEITAEGAFRAHIELDIDGNPRQVEAELWRPRTMSELKDPRLARAAISGGTPVVVRWQGTDRGVITLHDHVRPDASDAIDALESYGVETIMLSRDTYPVARRYGDSLGVSQVLAGIAPRKKAQAVRAVHVRGATVAMVGDASVMDCLRVADVGILLGIDDTRDLRDSSDAPAADVVVLSPKLDAIPRIINLARQHFRLVNGNIFLSWAYNVIALGLAVGGVLHPMAATVLMLGSSRLIEWRSNRARKF